MVEEEGSSKELMSECNENKLYLFANGKNIL